MLPDAVPILMAQIPPDFALPSDFLGILSFLLNMFYALAIRGYLIFILIGFIVYTTTYGDGFGKFMVAVGLFLFFAGPLIANVFAYFTTVDLITTESATQTWLGFLGMSDADLIYTIVWIGDAVGAICCLTGAILYFTKTVNDLESKGKSLIVRSLMLFAILSFFHVAPYII
jgi:hypothetical protein